MAVVKGTKQYKVKVVKDRPVFRVALIGGLGLAVFVSILLSYYVGYSGGMSVQERALKDLSAAQEKLKASEAANEQLQQSVTNIQLGAEVDRRANEEVRQQVITLKEQIAGLEEENSFYKGLMAPSENRKGLTIGSVELVNSERPRVYKYKVILQQLATKHQLLTGKLTFRVFGRESDLDSAYNISDLSEQYNKEAIKLRFKYFQTIAGELTIPETFEPEGIELVAQSTGKNAVTVTKRFGWLVQEI